MIKKLINWFSKDDEGHSFELNDTHNIVFTLKVDEVEVAKLRCSDGLWEFEYTDEFKNEYFREYDRIAGFPDLNKTYKKESLWPFFLTRIPGLKQPAVKEIIEKEKINSKDEAALLKRFGQHSISNPYELIPA
jgi:hypothetical protein